MERAAVLSVLLILVAGSAAHLEGLDSSSPNFNISTADCVKDTGYDGKYLICVEKPASVEVGKNTSFQLKVVTTASEQWPGDDELELHMTITLEHGDLAEVDPGMLDLWDGSSLTVNMHSLKAGRSEVIFDCFNQSYNSTDCPFYKEYLDQVRREVSFAHSHPLNIIIIIVGWIYFAAWSISFYPQIFLNFYRRSVVGLSFDFLALNITGFLCYALFNIGLFWIPAIQKTYFHRHPAGVNPVLLNDVIFSLHAFAATAFTIAQCFCLKRGGQRISYSAMIILALLWLVLIVFLFVSVGKKFQWLDFLYVASYVKLAVTLIKYVPQAWSNFKRRSTVGWSIGNVLLDFTGGTFSILQMFLLSYNYDDWKSFFGDPTKFGLGLFSILFDLLFMFQHYVLFRNATEKDVEKGYRKIESSYNEKDAANESKTAVNKATSSTSLADEQSPLLSSQKLTKWQKLKNFCKVTQ